MSSIKEISLLTAISFLLFVIYSFSVNQVNFMQNDDWVYYLSIQNFLDGSFKYHVEVGATFLTQAVLAYLFSLIFGISNLPFLTLAVSIGHFIVLYIVFRNIIKLDFLWSLLLALVFFFNPINQYLIHGFMVETYYLFFALVGIYFNLKYFESYSSNNLILANTFSFFAFMTRQLGIVLLISTFLFLLYKRKFKESLIQLVITLSVLLFYYQIFPRTPQMMSEGLSFYLLMNPASFIEFILEIGLYMAVWFSPILLLILTLIYKKNKFSIKAYLPLFGLTLIFATLIYYFVGMGEFPYWHNTFTLKGFFPGQVSGNKYYFKGFFDLYKVWSWLALLSVGAVGLLFLRKIPKSISYLHVLFVVSCGILIVIPYKYDRYLLLTFLSYLILIGVYIKEVRDYAILKIGVSAFIIFLAGLSYLFINEYLARFNYVWDKSMELISQYNIERNQVDSSHAWNIVNKTKKNDAIYFFTYDSVDVLDDSAYVLIEKYTLKFPGNIFVEPHIYLYEMNYRN